MRVSLRAWPQFEGLIFRRKWRGVNWKRPKCPNVNVLQNLTTSHQSVAFELRCLARGSQRLFFVSVFLHTEILTHLAAGFLLNFINYGPGRSCSMQQNGQAAPNRCFSGHPVVFIFARSSMAVENTPLCHCGKAEGFCSCRFCSYKALRPPWNGEVCKGHCFGTGISESRFLKICR